MQSLLGKRIVHITENYLGSNPGVTTSIVRLSDYLEKNGWHNIIPIAGELKAQIAKGVEIKTFPVRIWGRKWRYSPGMKDFFKLTSATPSSIFHLHGVWFAPQLLAAKVSSHQIIPTVLSPHGMLQPFLWQKSEVKKIKKYIYWKTIAYPTFRYINVIHALTRLERDNLVRYFPGKKVVIIPNAINLNEVDQFLSADDNKKPLFERPYILFIARIAREKGLDILIEAFSRSVCHRDFSLLIIGPETNLKYTKKLKSRVKKLGLSEQVLFLGPIFGKEKWIFYRNTWAFCTPSRTEGLSHVHLEAASAKVPVITTFNSGIDGLDKAGGILIPPKVEDLTRALKQVFSWTKKERDERGYNIRKFIEKHYSWEVVGPQYLSLYNDLLQKV